MAELTSGERRGLPASSFAATIERDGKRVGVLPIEDEAHVRNALARFDQVKGLDGGARRQAAHKIIAAAHRHGIEVEEDTAVWRAAHG